MNKERRKRILLLLWLVLLVAIFVLSFLRPRPRITGRVLLRGKPPAEIPITLDRQTAAIHTNGLTTRHYVVSPDGGLANVFVTIRAGLTNFPPPATPRAVLIESRGAWWDPYVTAVLTNQPIRFRNDKNILDNVHATPKNPGNNEFNFAMVNGSPLATYPWYRRLFYRVLPSQRPLPPGTDKGFPVPETFIRIKCDVHPWQFCYVCVSDHPFFAVTDAQGRFEFPPGLPAGRYLIEASHLKTGVVTQEVVVGRRGRQKLEFLMDVPARKQ